MNVLKKVKLNEMQMDKILNTTDNFDIIKRHLVAGDRNTCMYYIDGFVKDGLLQEVIRFILLTESGNMANVKTAKDYADNLMPFMEIDTLNNFDDVTLQILSGCVALFVDDIDEAIIIDSREYPQRQIEEPQNDKILRGSKDGFIETPIFNITLIRRRIRNPNLRFEYTNLGTDTKNDVFICYMTDRVDQEKLTILKEKLNNIKPKNLTMGTQSLIEALFEKKWYNPFPKVRFTGRPDVAASNVLEGKIILIVDNTPTAIILPVSIFDFFQEAQDYYFPPPTAVFLRVTRILLSFLSVFATPLWLLAIINMNILPEWLNFLIPNEWNSIPLVIQLLGLEFMISIIRAASINTPNMISSSISLIGAVILRRYCSNY